MIYIISIFRHLLEKLDGKIVWQAPRGPIGTAIKALNDHLLDPIVDFQPLPTKIPMVEPKIFCEACNRQRLAEILAGISIGREGILEKFWLTDYPVISTLRWLTTAERIAGVFIRDPNPSEELKIMMAFITGAYAPAHFRTFMYPNYEDSSHNFLEFIKDSKVTFLAFWINKFGS